MVQPESYEAILMKGIDTWRRLDGTGNVLDDAALHPYDDDYGTTTTTINLDQLGAILAFFAAYLVVVSALSCAICVGNLTFLVLYGSMSLSRRPFPAQQANDYITKGDFSIGCFDCFSDMQYCLHGCCCGTCRWADTLQAAGVTSFYAAIFFVIAASMTISIVLQVLTVLLQAVIGQLIPLGALTYVFVPMLYMYFRQNMRAKLNPSTPPFADKGQAALDCLSYCFCTCCSIVQDAREVDKAAGVRVDCCCKLTDLAPSAGTQMPAIGVPVGVGPQ